MVPVDDKCWDGDPTTVAISMVFGRMKGAVYTMLLLVSGGKLECILCDERMWSPEQKSSWSRAVY